MADDDAGAGAGPAPKRATTGARGPTKKAAGDPVKKAAARRSTAKRSGAAGTAAGDPPVKKAAARKATARKAAPGRTGARIGSGTDAGSPIPPRRGSRLAAEQTFDVDDDDWQQPAPPPSDDPAARARAALRSAAAGLRSRESQSVPVKESSVQTPESTEEILIGPGRRLAARPVPEPVVEPAPLPPSEPEPEPEWTAADQPMEEDEPATGRIPDAMDVLVLPGAGSPPAAPPAPPPPAPMPPSPEDRPTTAEGPPPAAATPPPPEAGKAGGGAGLSVLAIVVSVVVPVVGAVVGLVLASRARRRGLALAGLARVVAVVALVAWLVVGVVALVAAQDRGIDYSQLKVGDCFDSSATNQVRGIDVKPCSEPHNSEVFFIVTHPAGAEDPYPGKDALVQFAADACLGQPLTDYLGIPLEQSKFKDFEIVPQESAWKDGRRVLVCGIDTGGEGRVTGSVKGTSR